jgi:hypothetical protein
VVGLFSGLHGRVPQLVVRAAAELLHLLRNRFDKIRCGRNFREKLCQRKIQDNKYRILLLFGAKYTGVLLLLVDFFAYFIEYLHT